jgi:hypothetical protein
MKGYGYDNEVLDNYTIDGTVNSYTGEVIFD